jgi:hypothetical protein
VNAGEKAKLFSVDDDGRTAKLLEAPMKSAASIQRRGRTNLIGTYSHSPGQSVSTLERGWSLDSTLREIPWSAEDKGRTRAEVLLEDGWYSFAAATAALQKKFPVDSERTVYYSLSAGYSYPIPPITRLNSDHMFAVTIDTGGDPGRLLLFDRKGSRWQVLGETLPIGAHESDYSLSFLSKTNRILTGVVGGVCASSEYGLAVFHETRGSERDTVLYDANLDKRMVLARRPLADRSMHCQGIEMLQSLDGFLIGFSYPTANFLYLPGSEIKEIPKPQGTFSSHVSADGSQIYFADRTIIYRSANGEQHQLWPIN